MTRVLLTGAGGFVGHHTLEHILTETDWEVVCLDSFRHRGKTDRIREVISAHDGHDERQVPDCGEWCHRVDVLRHDLTAPIAPQLDAAIGPIDYVISMASDSHVDRSIIEPASFIQRNVELILTVMQWCRWRQDRGDGPEKIVHISTDEVYGPAPRGHEHAEGEPHRPSNPYSASKACQESIVFSYWRTYDVPVSITNTMNIIGERQDPEKFVPLVLARVLAGQTVPIHASAKGVPGSRFYLHARNQADALVHLLWNAPFLRYSELGGGDIERYNVVGESEIDNLEMARMIASFAGRRLDYELIDFHSSRPGHDLRYALDGSKMRGYGWEPPVPLETSLQRTVEWTMQHPEWLLDAGADA